MFSEENLKTKRSLLPITKGSAAMDGLIALSRTRKPALPAIFVTTGLPGGQY